MQKREIRHGLKVSGYIVGILLLSRITYFIAAYIWRQCTGENGSWIDLINRFDSGWYQTIVTGGYSVEPAENAQASWAFFPLYSIVLKLLFVVFPGVSLNTLGTLLSTVCLGMAMYAIYWYCRDTRDEKTAEIVLLLLGFGPYSFYFSSTYTESMFIMLLGMCLYLVQRRRWMAAGIACAFLSACRNSGVMFFFLMLYEVLSTHEFFRKGRQKEAILSIIKEPKTFLGLMLCPLGAFLYMGYLHWTVGDGFAFLHVQRAWGKSTDDFIVKTFRMLFSEDHSEQYLALSVMAVFAAAVYLCWRKRIGECVFWLGGLMPAVMTSPYSVPRYMVGSLMVYFVAAEILQKLGENWRVIALLTCAGINYILLFGWFAQLGFLT